MNRIKVVWICHFSNQEVLRWINPWFKRKEISQWIPNLIKGIRGRTDIELHVISLHSGIYFYKKHEDRGITYHFINYGIPFVGIPWPKFIPIDIITNYILNKRIIRFIVNHIKPDIINLFGAENPNYSSAIFQFITNYPVLINIQGFISQSSNKNSLKTRTGMKVEQEIYRKFQNFAGEEDSKVFLSTFNKKFNYYKFYFPVNEDLIRNIEYRESEYDILYYGRLVKDKGIEDFIKVIIELKRTLPKIKALIIGGCTPKYLKTLNALIAQAECLDNIRFTGFLDTQEPVFNYVKASKILLVPTYNDRLPSTIREAMLLKTAIIAYKTGGIPFINKYQENIKLVEVGDFISMAECVTTLLSKECARLNLINNAYKYAIREYSLQSNSNSLINTYYKVISNSK